MNRIALGTVALLALTPLFVIAQTPEDATPSAPGMKKLTPILVCEAIEPSLSFWVEQLGFEVTLSIPTGESIGFAMLNHGSVELMLQSYVSIEEDMPSMADNARGQKAFLYLEVEDLDAVAARLGDTEITMERRETFYGATEIGVRTPAGHFVTLAQMTGE